MSRRGTNLMLDQFSYWLMQGNVFNTQQGDAGTLIDFAETAYDEDQPQWSLLVPSGTIVMPLSLIVDLTDAAGTDTTIVWSAAEASIGNGTSTGLTIKSSRVDAATTIASACTSRSLYTGNAAAATGLFEFARMQDAFAQAAGSTVRYALDAKSDSNLPILVGPATLQMHIHATSTAPKGFGNYSWLEVPSGHFSADRT